MVLGAKIGEPVPAKDAFNTDDNVIEVGKDQFEKQFRIGFDILVNFYFSFLIDNADIHFSGVQIDAAVVTCVVGCRISWLGLLRVMVVGIMGNSFLHLHLREGHNYIKANSADAKNCAAD